MDKLADKLNFLIHNLLLTSYLLLASLATGIPSIDDFNTIN